MEEGLCKKRKLVETEYSELDLFNMKPRNKKNLESILEYLKSGQTYTHTKENKNIMLVENYLMKRELLCKEKYAILNNKI